jgi:phosphatidylserine/phosphatidylglycerophosphate/cardiolipin synthase-like enzyme
VKLIVQPDAGVLPLVQAIRRARKIVEIAIFRFDRQEIERELQQAVARGVRVRALIAHTNRGGENRLRKLEQRLLSAGVTVARTAEDLLRYHGKFLVVDETLHVFGFNFTKLDIDKRRSFGIQTRDRRTVAEALKLFEADSTRRSYKPSRSNLVVSPDTARAMLTAFIKGARKEIAIYDQKITDPGMIKLLKERAAKGVQVRVIGCLKGPDGDVKVRPLKAMRPHVRAIIRDGTRAFVGSQSLRKDELDARREVGLLISNPKVTRQLMKVFESDWEECLTPKAAAKEEKKEAATDEAGQGGREGGQEGREEGREGREGKGQGERRGRKEKEKEEESATAGA